MCEVKHSILFSVFKSILYSENKDNVDKCESQLNVMLNIIKKSDCQKH